MLTDKQTRRAGEALKAAGPDDYRVGIDIGGTFTDLVVMDEASGSLRLVKMSSTPSDPSRAFMRVVERMLAESGVSPAAATYLAHGTTVATNTIIEGKGAKTALITTEGFRDVLEIARQIRPKLYDLFCDKPPPLVPRYLCFPVPERLDAAGQVLKPLDEAAVIVLCGRLKEEQIESVAVCLLHSYANPVHERRIGEIIRQQLPEIKISLSSELCPEMREYFRASTTAVNAVVMPIISRYIHRLEENLAKLGMMTELHLMTSSGGILSSKVSQEKPVNLIESGPAAGVTGAAYLGAMAGYQNLISFDMGGTTAKMGLIEGGKPRIAPNFEVGSAATSQNRSAGYPVRTPVIDLVEIGAGGGSIAWIDDGGALRVGPKSGGADPGPACYGKGQLSPTITDAHLFLGRINPDYFIGGEQKLRKDLSEKAIRALAEPLGMDPVALAQGILDIANASMVAAIQLISVQRGFDPRDFVLIGYGGAGPLHANALAEQMRIPRVLIPMSPGLTCALGLLVGDIKHNFKRSYLKTAQLTDPADLDRRWAELEQQGTEQLVLDGISPDRRSYVRQLDMRYCGQSFELTLDCPVRPGQPTDLEAIKQLFFQQHRLLYGYASEDEPTEIVNLGLTAIGAIRRPVLRKFERGTADASAARKGERQAYFQRTGLTTCLTYDRYRLKQGNRIEGPAIVEEYDSTVVIHPDYFAEVDAFGSLFIQEKKS